MFQIGTLARYFLFLLLILTAPRTWSADSEVFSFHLPSEPHSLDPALLSTNDSSYLFANLYRGLYKYHESTGLVPEGAKSCVWKDAKHLRCTLQENLKWSDGTPITHEDYLRAFRRLVSASGKSLGVELLKNIEGALDIHLGRKPLTALGIQSPEKGRLEFSFQTADPDFLYKLTSSILVPVHSEAFPAREQAASAFYNGPYKIGNWQIGKRLHLIPNPNYQGGFNKRPDVDVYFIDEDQTALNLYDQGKLKFLRRLPTLYIDKYRKRSDFLQMPVARFDYLGFGPELQKYPELRTALAYSLDFKELKTLYQALGIPGCPSFSEKFMDRPHCFEFDLKKAKEALAKVPTDVIAKRWKLGFSKLGGDDIKKGAEWFQAQWRKNLGLTVDLEQSEQGVYLNLLRTHPPDLFRKGVGLERPTCLAALETFSRNGPENFLHLELPEYEKIMTKLALAKSEGEQRRLCGEGVQFLLDQRLFIPLGRIHFTMLADPHFKGWRLNEMNQLNLENLQYQNFSPSSAE